MHRARSNLSADEGEWINSDKLEAGDSVRTPSGEWKQVVSISKIAGEAAVYNFEVENNHDYYVGSAGVLVHNQTECGIPQIKVGSAGGETAGQRFPDAIREAAFTENPDLICVYCRQPGIATQVDHAIPKAVGGNATFGNAQLACPFCNASKGARQFPVNPAPGYTGPFPPPWW